MKYPQSILNPQQVSIIVSFKVYEDNITEVLKKGHPKSNCFEKAIPSDNLIMWSLPTSFLGAL